MRYVAGLKKHDRSSKENAVSLTTQNGRREPSHGKDGERKKRLKHRFRLKRKLRTSFYVSNGLAILSSSCMGGKIEGMPDGRRRSR